MSNLSSQPGNLPQEAGEVMRLLEEGHSKSAVEAAKALHKRVASPASEALLVRAYAARAESMREHNLAAEADALLTMVREKYPCSAALLAEGATAPGAGSFEDKVRPLADPDSPREARAAAENWLRIHLDNPADLANCTALSADHPLRTGALAIVQALRAVTSGPVDDAAIALPEISHRSPLGPWKPLLRAIACFYRRDDESCERNLAAIDPSSAPARVVPALRSMLPGEDAYELEPAAKDLVKRVASDMNLLQAVLDDVEEEFAEGTHKTIVSAIRDAISIARRECPELVSELRRQIGVRAQMMDLSMSSVNGAMGGAAPADARSGLLYARLVETDPERVVDACFSWDIFRHAAIEENWFADRGPETAAIYLHLAHLLRDVDEEELRKVNAQAHRMLRREAPEGMEAPEFDIPILDANWLYQTACEMDPHPEAFEKWIEWAEKVYGAKAAEAVAQAWSQALPRDPRPLLRLMNYAGERNALKKALDYLSQAEKLDALNPEVHTARLRFMLREIVRHLKGRRVSAAYKSLALIRSLPQAKEKDRPILVDAFEYVAHRLDLNGEAEAAWARRIDEKLGSQRAGMFVRGGLASLCGFPVYDDMDSVVRSGGDWIESVARVHVMGRDVEFTFYPPPGWRRHILKALESPDGNVKAMAIDVVGRIGLRQKWYDVAFAASACGLANHPDSAARFLLLRARALPRGHYERCEECVLAALELARRQRDLAIANEAAEQWQALTLGGMMGSDNVHLSEKQIKKVLDRERNQRKPPRARADFDGLDDDIFDFDIAPPPGRRRRSGRSGSRRGGRVDDLDVPF